MASLGLSNRGPTRSHSRTRGAVDSRITTTGSPFPADVVFRQTPFSVRLSRRGSTWARASAAVYSPRFVFSLLPDAGDIQTDLAPPTLDYGVVRQRQLVSYAAGGNATFQRVAAVVAERDRSAAASQTIARRQLRHDDSQLWRRLFALGHRDMHRSAWDTEQQDTDYPAFDGSAPSAIHVANRMMLAWTTPGLCRFRAERRSRSAPARRRSTTAMETFFTVTAKRVAATTRSAARGKRTSCTRAASASWRVSPSRFSPIRSNANHSGTPDQQVHARWPLLDCRMETSALGSAANNYHSVSGDHASRMDRSSATASAMYGNYYYYGYEFDEATPTLAPIPRQVGRHGVRAGLIFRFPLLQERTPRVTR